MFANLGPGQQIGLQNAPPSGAEVLYPEDYVARQVTRRTNGYAFAANNPASAVLPENHVRSDAWSSRKALQFSESANQLHRILGAGAENTQRLSNEGSRESEHCGAARPTLALAMAPLKVRPFVGGGLPFSNRPDLPFIILSRVVAPYDCSAIPFWCYGTCSCDYYGPKDTESTLGARLALAFAAESCCFATCVSSWAGLWSQQRAMLNCLNLLVNPNIFVNCDCV